ncbi:MAG TPA: flavodoxin [Lachnospiraceae bacterium]
MFNKIITLFSGIVALLLLLSFTACGSSTSNISEAGSQTASDEESETKQAEDSAASEESSKAISGETDVPESHSDVLIVYFSVTGTTKGVAERIASLTGGDIYEIQAVEAYSPEDLDYNDSGSRSTTEQNDKNIRPEIGGEELSLSGYTTIYLGYPIWWGEEPRIMDTFVEKYSFDGITVIPFCTSASSGISKSSSNMEALAGSGRWLKGRRFTKDVSEAGLQDWIESF